MSIGISAQESVNPLVNRVDDSKYDFLLNFLRENWRKFVSTFEHQLSNFEF